MKNTTLVIMAAGIGSRFGKGIKQLEPVGPNGEIIMDYSIHDALEAGFNKVVFIIRKDLEKDFKEIIGNRIEKLVAVEYVYQEVDYLPAGFEKPEGRTKPWGTGHAIWCCKGVVKEPFAVINADDYYGKAPFVQLHDYLIGIKSEDLTKLDICMAGFVLKNTLSDSGGVTRGICRLDEEHALLGIDETSNIVKTGNGAAVQNGQELKPIDVNSLVSMNMWGLTPEFMDILEDGFAEFLSNLGDGQEKKEYLLPVIIDKLLKEDKVIVTVLKTEADWFGVTYQEDKLKVVEAFKELIAKGIYKEKLFN